MPTVFPTPDTPLTLVSGPPMGGIIMRAALLLGCCLLAALPAAGLTVRVQETADGAVHVTLKEPPRGRWPDTKECEHE